MTEEDEQEQQNGILNGSILTNPLLHGILDDDDDFPNVLDINYLIASNVEQGVQNHGKRKINYRHTTEQIQRLEE